MKKLLLATTLSLAAFAASATPLNDLSGNVTINMNGVTSTGVNNAAGSTEATWGLGAIVSIQGTGGQIWQPGAPASGGTYLYYMIYGVADQGPATQYGPIYELNNVGATGGAADGQIHLDVYESNTPITALNSNFSASPGTRTGFSTDSLFTGLVPYLELDFVPGINNSDPSALMTQVLDTDSTITSGSGDFFANVVGGTAAAQWTTSVGPNVSGQFTFSPNGAANGNGTCTAAQVTANTCFQEEFDDPIHASLVPEPGSIALFGLGLAALAAMRRRKH